jgi:hypothetical protein
MILRLKGALMMNWLYRGLNRINPWLRLAWLLPDTLVYWCGIRMAAHATTGDYSDVAPTKVSVMDMLDAWEKRGG